MNRVAYVLAGEPGGRTADELLALLPTARRTAAALVDTGQATVDVVLRVPRQHHERAPRELAPGVLLHTVPDGAAGDAAEAGGNASRRGMGGDTRTSLGDRARTRAMAEVMAEAVAAARPDVVHVNGLVFPRVVTAIARRRSAPIVAQHHGELPPGGVRTRLALRRASRHLAAALFTGADHGQGSPWRSLLGGTPMVDVLEASSDFAPLDLGAPHPTAVGGGSGLSGDPAIVWVGRPTPGKDLPTAIDAFARLRSVRPAARLWVLTADPHGCRAVVTARCADRAAAEAISVVGPVPHAAMAGWFGAADAVLSTSRHEGSGYATIEAMACGCPVVVTDIAPHHSIVAGDGRLVAPGDVTAFAEALAALDRSAAARVATRAAFDRRLGWTNVATQLLDAYRSVLADRGAARDR